MGFIVKAKRKGTNERYYNVTRGSGEGGGTKTFETRRQAQTYSRSLTSFETKIEERKKRARKSRDDGFGGYGGFF